MTIFNVDQGAVIIDKIEINPPTFKIYENFTINVTFTSNYGLQDLSLSWKTAKSCAARYYFSDVELSTQINTPTKPGTHTITLENQIHSWWRLGGWYYFYLQFEEDGKRSTQVQFCVYVYK
ncbi:hypothetical protein EIN_093650 [Entamoeba invadens IP1]|uniref:Uncharacterized protein n=1 Tax=Entamoeba invadens IP1 TaxID=370355 RepID=A0A0A1U389_ENTIV|nr:hypothetical protein EIN_093650 [Entamoeba invadens IP1]ELP87208.1 hypothetical protein EIN_093650 [Entamoeba invadens IP1]|eukprot:XP_004253979.1 hypothetical protein EIN_093650 [Entamoeba invadens IP1]